MAHIDQIHLKFPCYGARKISQELVKCGFKGFGRTHTKRLMEAMGIKPIYPKPNTSKAARQHPKFPYLLRGKRITHPNQVWSTDITYIRLGKRHVYLSAVIDWFSRMIVGWRLHDSLEAAEACACIHEAVQHHGTPAIVNSDQGATYTSAEYVSLLEELGIQQSMDGKARWVDNVLMERWFRTLKQECIYIEDYTTMRQLRTLIAGFVHKYNFERIHQSLDYATPASWYYSGLNAVNLPLAA